MPETPFAHDLILGKSVYKAEMIIGPQEILMDIVKTVAKTSQHTYKVSAEMTSSLGYSKDTVTLHSSSLRPLTRHAELAAITLTITYQPTSLLVESNPVNGSGSKVVLLQEQLLSDGAAEPFSIACLPLVPGYKHTFLRFDSQTSTANLTILQVEGREHVRVPAGNFSCLKVVLTEVSNNRVLQEIYISETDLRLVVKIKSTTASVGGTYLQQSLIEFIPEKQREL